MSCFNIGLCARIKPNVITRTHKQWMPQCRRIHSSPHAAQNRELFTINIIVFYIFIGPLATERTHLRDLLLLQHYKTVAKFHMHVYQLVKYMH